MLSVSAPPLIWIATGTSMPVSVSISLILSVWVMFGPRLPSACRLMPTTKVEVGSIPVGNSPSGPIAIETWPSSSEAATGATK
ncbi:hypothetical protein D3C80_756830 [compost metagenome]